MVRVVRHMWKCRLRGEGSSFLREIGCHSVGMAPRTTMPLQFASRSARELPRRRSRDTAFFSPQTISTGISLYVLGPVAAFIVAVVLYVVERGPIIGIRWLEFLSMLEVRRNRWQRRKSRWR